MTGEFSPREAAAAMRAQALEWEQDLPQLEAEIEEHLQALTLAEAAGDTTLIAAVDQLLALRLESIRQHRQLAESLWPEQPQPDASAGDERGNR